MGYKSTHRFARISPTKVRPIADLVRGRPVSLALESLQFVPNRGARMLEKVIKTAVADAQYRGARKVEDMIVKVAKVDEGPRMKRFQPHARGMAFQILRRMSHIHIEIDEG